MHVLIAVLLAIAVLVTLISACGVLVMDSFYDRLHYLAPISTIATVCLFAAIFLRELLSQAGVKSLLIAAVILFMSPALSQSIARAGRIREFGGWNPDPQAHPGGQEHPRQHPRRGQS